MTLYAPLVVQRRKPQGIFYGAIQLQRIYGASVIDIFKSVNHEEFVFIWEELLKLLSKEDMEFMAVVSQQLWLQRNAFVYGNKINLSSLVVECVVESLEAYHEANSLERGNCY